MTTLLLNLMTLVEPCIRISLSLGIKVKLTCFWEQRRMWIFQVPQGKKEQGGRTIENKVYKYQGNPEKF